MSRDERKKLSELAVYNAKKILKQGDRIRLRHCPGTRRTITFWEWDGIWIISKSGKNDYHPFSIDRLNGKNIDFKI
jgi:hypothetical protein